MTFLPRWMHLLPVGWRKGEITFWYKGDEVIYNLRYRFWVSMGCEGIFHTLAEMDAFWAAFKRAYNEGESEKGKAL